MPLVINESTKNHGGPVDVRIPDLLGDWVDWGELVVRLVKTSTSSKFDEEVSHRAAFLLKVRALKCEGLYQGLIDGLDFSQIGSELSKEGPRPARERNVHWNETFEFDDENMDWDLIEGDDNKGVALSDWRTIVLERVKAAWAQAVRMYQNYVWIFRLHLSLGEPNVAARNRTLYAWFLYGLQGRLEKVLKYKTAYCLAGALMQEEFPEEVPLFPGDRPDYLIAGGLGHIFRKMCFVGKGRLSSVRLAQDIYFAKRGSHAVDDRFVEASLKKNHETLCSHAEYDTPNWMGYQIRRTVREIYGKTVWNKDKNGVEKCHLLPNTAHKADKVPTFGSCVQNPRGKGGAFGCLIVNNTIGNPEGYLSGYARYKTNVAEIRIPNPYWEEDEAEIVRRARLGSVVPCIPVPLLEPFKVRVITRGCAYSYHLARQWQRPIHHRMADNDVFRLTMGPLESRYVDELLGRTYDLGTDGHWISGDYESATDNLHPDLSEICLDEIMHWLRVPYPDRPVLFRCLTRHVISWEGKADRRTMLQNWGQLMGSPISFPILCIVNAALTRSFLEREWGRRFTLRQVPMLVNGDDILFYSPKRNDDPYQRWKDMVTTAGLKPSVGKNYVSDRFLVINSEIFYLTKGVDFFGVRRFINQEKLPSVNLGLYYGEQKSVSSHALEKSIFGSNIKQRDDITTMAHDWVDGFPEDRDFMNSCFLAKWRETLHRAPQEMCWWVHRKFGGLGLPVTRKVVITERQRKLAAMLWTDGDFDIAVRLKGISQPLPAFVEMFFRECGRVARSLGVERKRGGRHQLEPFWDELTSFVKVGFDQSDPTGYGTFLKSFMNLWKSSATHWSKPLSFRKCIAGPDRDWGIDSRVFTSR